MAIHKDLINLSPSRLKGAQLPLMIAASPSDELRAKMVIISTISLVEHLWWSNEGLLAARSQQELVIIIMLLLLPRLETNCSYSCADNPAACNSTIP